jgi:HK97 family phage major capsid protein
MNKTYPKRGIIAVRADIDAKAVIEDLQKSWHEFKAENDRQLAEIRAKGHSDPLLSEKVDKINSELSRVVALKDQIDQLENIIARGQFPSGGDAGVSQAQKEHAKAFDKFFRKGVDNGLRDLEIKAGLSTLSDPDGGYLVPEQNETTIDRVATVVSAMRRLASSMTIGTDTYKKLVGVGGASSGWVGEKGTRTETDTPSLKEIMINVKEIYANPAATQSLLDDSRVDIAAWLGSEVDVVFAEQESDAFIDGDGVMKPRGILGYTNVANSSYAWGSIGYTATGAAATFTNVDKLIDLQHSLKAIYRNGSGFLMNDATQGHVRKFKDGDGAYIWRPGLETGSPNTLLGKPVDIDDNMPDIGAGTYPIAYANFKRAYLIIDRQGIRVLRDPYTNKPYVHFYTTKRVGGGVVMYEAIKLLKVAAA